MSESQPSAEQGAERLPRAEELFPSRNVAILASGEGTTLQAVLDAREQLDGIDLRAVITNRPESMAAHRARNGGLELVSVNNDDDQVFREKLFGVEAGFAIALGYDRIIPPQTVEAYRNRMLNLHPAPLPLTKGKMGVAAHQVVIDKKEFYSGPTINWVTEGVDEGPTWKNRWVPVKQEETAEELYERCRPVERELVIEVLQEIVGGRFDR